MCMAKYNTNTSMMKTITIPRHNSIRLDEVMGIIHNFALMMVHKEPFVPFTSMNLSSVICSFMTPKHFIYTIPKKRNSKNFVFKK